MSYVSPSVVTDEILEAVPCLSVTLPMRLVACSLFSFTLTSRAGVVVAEAFDDVVLNEGACSPAVDRDIAVDIGGVPRAAVFDGAVTTSCPALACDEVVAVCPVHAELARSLIVIRHGAAVSGVVEGVEEAVVGAGACRGRAVHELLERGGTINGRGGECARGGYEGEEGFDEHPGW